MATGSSSNGLRRLTRGLRERVPSGVEDFGRSALLGAGRLTAGMRMQPGFLVIGGQRCGTTTMFRLLTEHPDIRRPVVSKGIGYFDVNYDRGPKWYAGHFPLRNLPPANRRAIAFESSGYYSFHPLAAERIAADLPDVKLIMLVRDPVERAFSAYKHEYRRGFETESFERALELEPERLAGEVERMIADPTYQSNAHRHHAYVGRGMYADQLDRLTTVVDPSRVHVVDADAFFDDPVASFSELISWLGLSVWEPRVVAKENATAVSTMDPTVREMLRSRFEESDRRLTQYLGGLPSWRR